LDETGYTKGDCGESVGAYFFAVSECVEKIFRKLGFGKKEIYIMTNSEAWDYAIGMIKVDGLEPTEDFKRYIEKEKRGEITMEDAKKFLDKKYKMKEPMNA